MFYSGGLLTVAESRTLSLSGMRHADERLSSILYPDSGIRVRGPNCPARGLVSQLFFLRFSLPKNPHIDDCDFIRLLLRYLFGS